MVIVPEDNQGEQPAEPTAETEIVRLFAEAGYVVVDQKQYAAIRYGPQSAQFLQDPASQEARSFTANQGADVLIIGKAWAELAGTAGAGVASCRGHITIKAMWTRGDGQVLCANDSAASGADIAPSVAGKIALRKVGTQAGRYVMQQIAPLVGGALPPPETTEEAHRPRVGVLRFKDQSQWAQGTWELGMQIPHLISNELMKCGAFDVVELNNVDDVKALQADTQGGMYTGEGELGTLTRPDFAVIGRITGFGVKKQGGLGGLLGGIIGVNTDEFQVSIFVQIVDAKTGVIKASGEASGDATGNIVAAGGNNVFAGLQQSDDTANVRATRKAVIAAVKLVVAAMPGAPTPCPKCGKFVKPGARFCPECGAKIEVAPRTCPKCHAPLEPGSKFCPQCGTKVQTAK